MHTAYERVIAPYLAGKAETCSYCDYLEPLVLLPGRYAYVTIAIGQYVEGYVQVCTRSHRTAMTGLLDYEARELETMRAVVREAYRRLYGTPGVAFEHGKAGSCMWTGERAQNALSLCHHCHVHYLPRSIDIRADVRAYCREEIPIQSLEDLRQIRAEVLEGAPYLYFEDANLQGYVYPVNDKEIPRQFLRRCVARKLGMEERADWHTYPGTEFFAATEKRLGPVLRKVYSEMTGSGVMGRHRC